MNSADFRAFLERSGFAALAETDRSGRILTCNCPGMEPGKLITRYIPTLSLDTPAAQTVSAGDRTYRVAVTPSDRGYAVLLSDITGLVSASEALLKFEALQSGVMKTIPDIVIVKDPDGNWLGCNARAEEIRETLAPKNGSVPHLSPVCPESDREAWESGSPIRKDEKLADGRIFDVSKSPVWNSDGTPQCLTVVARDVTEHREREKKVRSLNVLVETLRKIDRLILQSSAPAELIQGAVSVIDGSELFEACTTSLTAAVRDHLNSLEWKDGTCVCGAIPGMPGCSWTAVRFSETDDGSEYFLCSPAEGLDDILGVSHAEVLSDVARDLDHALRTLALKEEQRQATLEVLKARNMLDAFLENFPGPAFIRDSRSRYLKMNGKLFELAECADWLGKEPEDIYEPDVVRRLRARDSKVLRKGYLCQVRDFEDDNGEPVKLETHYFRIEQEGNEPLIGGVALDITERLRHAQALIQSEERYRTIYENTGTAMAILDPDGMVISANANIERLSGFVPEEVVGKRSWTEFVHPEDIPMVTRMREERLVSDSRRQMEFEFRLKTRDGSYRHVHACTGTIPNSGGMGVLSLSDISNLIEYQIRLNDSLEKTSSLLRAIPDLMFVLTRDGDYRDFHTNDSSILLVPPEEITGSNIADLGLAPEELSQVMKAVIDSVDNRRTGSVEYSVNLPDGKHFYEAGISPYEQDSVLVLCRDVTKRKHAEEEQKKLEAQVRHVQKLESLGVLAGGIAHDFNNILMAISGNVYLARRALSTGANPLDYLEAVEKATGRASDLAGQMLSYSGRGESRIVPVNLSEIAADVSEILRVSLSRKAEVIFDMDPDIPVIMADAAQVRQVVMNLITNASEALEQDPGKVMVSTGSMHCDRKYLDTLNRTEKLKTGMYSWIKVEDTGKGMERDLFDKIFDPFFTTKFAGRGLGLSAVLGIMSSHGGALEIQSVPGTGSSFTALFPVAKKVPVMEPESGEVNGAVRKTSGTVLFVEDEPLIRSVAETMISGMGLSVTLAANGLEGLREFTASPSEYSLVILDLTMPGMDGDEVFREIRKLSPKTPVLISSGYNEHEMLTRFAGGKPEGFLKKPYSVSELAEKIQALLSLNPS